MRTIGGLASCALLAVVLSSEAFTLPFPLSEVGGRWAPAEAGDVQITYLRVEAVPSMDDTRDSMVWSIDETVVIHNHGIEDTTLNLGVANAWSANAPSPRGTTRDFWAEAYVNGAPVRTEVVEVIPNPALSSVTYRTAKRFELSIDAGETAHVRVRFALPAETADIGEVELVLPFHLRALWDGPIDFGNLSVMWSTEIFSFRTNLPGYALYRDGAEWFVRGFQPDSDLRVRFLPRQATFALVARDLGCPMPWEVLDRVSEGNLDPVRDMLGTYETERLRRCAALPAILRGSAADAESAGLANRTLDEFAPMGSEITGPLLLADPGYSEAVLTESERIYAGFLTQEILARQGRAAE